MEAGHDDPNRRVSRLESHMNTIISGYSCRDIEPTNHKLHSVRKGEYEIYGEIDENGCVTGYGTLRHNGSILFEGEFDRSKRSGYGL